MTNLMQHRFERISCVSFVRNISKVYILAFHRILSCIQEFQIDHFAPHPLKLKETYSSFEQMIKRQ